MSNKSPRGNSIPLLSEDLIKQLDERFPSIVWNPYRELHKPPSHEELLKNAVLRGLIDELKRRQGEDHKDDPYRVQS